MNPAAEEGREAGERGGRRADGGGEAAAAVRRAAEKALPGGRAREQDAGRRGVDEALWLRAASWKAASDARQRGRGPGTPIAPVSRREPIKPWFTESADEELWLSADGTGEPWFFEDWT